MNTTVRTLVLGCATSILVAIGGARPDPSPSPSSSSAPLAPSAAPAPVLTPLDIVDRLPANKMIRYDGRRLTRDQLRAEIARRTVAPLTLRRASFATLAAEIDAREIQRIEAAARVNDIARQTLQRTLKAPITPVLIVAPPHITAIEGAAYYMPGFYVIVKGSGFSPSGAMPSVKLDGRSLVIPPNTPTAVYLTPNEIIARIPADLTGFPDGPAQVTVTVKGKTSNAVPIQFKARRAARAIDAEHVSVAMCQHTGGGCHWNGGLMDWCDSDICQWHFMEDAVAWPLRNAQAYQWNAVGSYPIRALHETRLMDDTVYGIDDYRVPLYNGYTIVGWSSTYTSPDTAWMVVSYVGMVDPVTVDVATLYADAYAGMAYGVTLTLEGPAGVPYDHAL